MKVAITSTGSSLESVLDSRFGRCSYFVIYDTIDKNVEFVINPNKNALEGAGPASVQLIASNNVNEIISFDFGAKIKSLLTSLNIKMTIEKDQTKTVKEIIETLK
ncbi:MAG: hypothetical protein A2X12_09890 [Bacteroidetes bacterium GWE2_29_8]|nr:MAG: hypothetical protein A2X12_09890 [Bacteroidetes bacterium GWE2_29_8]OFY14123.1 MAG: hypothetical protein A2X02_02500 [Bacteroidetes bacterium GWF2_29_10]